MLCVIVVCRSNGAYEALRSSGCLWLPSQRTLRDRTHYVHAQTGFSDAVDKMLMDAAKVKSCPEREKCTLLTLNEMHIWEDLVFDKHTGTMIGFANLGEINEHLMQFERNLLDDAPLLSQPAKSHVGGHGTWPFQLPAVPVCTVSQYGVVWRSAL